MTWTYEVPVHICQPSVCLSCLSVVFRLALVVVWWMLLFLYRVLYAITSSICRDDGWQFVSHV